MYNYLFNNRNDRAIKGKLKRRYFLIFVVLAYGDPYYYVYYFENMLRIAVQYITNLRVSILDIVFNYVEIMRTKVTFY